MTFDFLLRCFPFLPDSLFLPSVSSRFPRLLVNRKKRSWTRCSEKAKLNFFLFARRFMLKSLRRSLKHSLIYSKNVFSYKITKPTKWKWRWKRARARKEEENCNWKTYNLIENGNYFFISCKSFYYHFFCFPFPFSILKCKVMSRKIELPLKFKFKCEEECRSWLTPERTFNEGKWIESCKMLFYDDICNLLAEEKVKFYLYWKAFGSKEIVWQLKKDKR